MNSKEKLSSFISQQMNKKKDNFAVKRVKQLKELSPNPNVEKNNLDNFYIEPVTIEYYVTKETRFANEIKYLNIELHDPKPKNKEQRLIWDYFIKKNNPIDLIEVIEKFPQFSESINKEYKPTLDLIKRASKHFKNGITNSPKEICQAIYLLEVIKKTEPTLSSLEILGNHTTYNINWGIRFLNRHNISISLEDPTVKYLIKRHRNKLKKQGKLPEERFEILANIYLQQAFPIKDDEILP